MITTETKKTIERKKLLGSSTKVVKGEKFGYLSGIMYLAPHSLSGVDVCRYASDGCKEVCLYKSGHGKFTRTQLARIAKTQYLIGDRKAFSYNIDKDILALSKKAAKEGLTPCVRLNGTSDLGFNDVYRRHEGIQFYDYTPNHLRYKNYLLGKLPANYHLTFSKKEDNDCQVDELISLSLSIHAVKPISIAVCFTELPKRYKGLPVIDGDVSDLRFTDPANVIVGLKFKGSKADKIKAISSGFCVDPSQDSNCVT